MSSRSVMRRGSSVRSDRKESSLARLPVVLANRQRYNARSATLAAMISGSTAGATGGL